MYDYLIIGAGLFGSIFARIATDSGKKCIVVEERNEIGGNCRTDPVRGIEIHKYGPHIFHTGSDKVWSFINRYTKFNHYSHRPRANYNGKIYSFPINLLTLQQLWGVSTPKEAELVISEKTIKIPNPSNFEEAALSTIGRELYEMFIYEYTKRHWGAEPATLPPSIFNRLKFRTNFNDSYYDHKHQGIPIHGYTEIFHRLLDGIEVKIGERSICRAKTVIYTGSLDELMGYRYGVLPYRTLRFQHEFVQGDYQGCSTMHFTGKGEFNRVVEHKHFYLSDQDDGVITTEYPDVWTPDKVRLYPIETAENLAIHKRYVKDLPANYKIGGRLATYKYLNMDQVIGAAMKLAKVEGLC